MQRPTRVGFIALSLLIPHAQAQDADTAPRPAFVAAFRWAPLVIPAFVELPTGVGQIR
jgi:hypothetical protein